MNSNVEYLKQNYDNFNVMDFAKTTKIESLTLFKKEFAKCLAEITNLNLNKNKNIKDMITWARQKRNKQNEVSTTTLISY